MPQYSIRPLLLSSRFRFPIQWMLSCTSNTLITSPSVIILLPSDITYCSNVGYYITDKYVCIIHLPNVPLTHFLFTNTNNIIPNMNLSSPSLLRFLFISIVKIIRQRHEKNILKTLASCLTTFCVMSTWLSWTFAMTVCREKVKSSWYKCLF